MYAHMITDPDLEVNHVRVHAGHHVFELFRTSWANVLELVWLDVGPDLALSCILTLEHMMDLCMDGRPCWGTNKLGSNGIRKGAVLPPTPTLPPLAAHWDSESDTGSQRTRTSKGMHDSLCIDIWQET